MKKLILATLCLFALSACNTMEGFGKDVKKAGQSVENAAAKHTN